MDGGGSRTAASAVKVVDSLRQMTAAAESRNITLALENTLSAEENLDMIRKVDSEAVKVYFDVSNAMYWKHDPCTELKVLGRYVAQIHFKDGKESHSDAMIGEGIVNWPGVSKRCGRSGTPKGILGWSLKARFLRESPL